MRLRLGVAALVVMSVACASSFVEGDGGATIAGDAGSDSVTDASLLSDADAGTVAPPRVVGSTVSGEVVFVDAGDAGTTTVILAPESFDLEAFHETAPSGPRATDVTGAWSIRDVPPGAYLVLAGFERDGFVLDPSTSPPKIVVSGGAGEAVVVPSAQKLVRALPLVTIRPMSTAPAITVVDGEGEDAYGVSIVDWQGKTVFSSTEPASTTNANVTFEIDAGLVVPLRYRFRVTAKKAGATLTQTEDLAAIRPAAPDDT